MAMSKPAYKSTKVPVRHSQADIEAMLKKNGVEAVRFTSLPSGAILEFAKRIPNSEDFIGYRINVRPKLKPDVRDPVNELNKAERQIWRVLYWHLKAKFEAISFGLTEFEEDFLPYMLITDSEGRTASASQLFFEHMARRLPAGPDEPFGGLKPALTEGENE